MVGQPCTSTTHMMNCNSATLRWCRKHSRSTSTEPSDLPIEIEDNTSSLWLYDTPAQKQSNAVNLSATGAQLTQRIDYGDAFRRSTPPVRRLIYHDCFTVFWALPGENLTLSVQDGRRRRRWWRVLLGDVVLELLISPLLS
jgi:hypothetical protein